MINLKGVTDAQSFCPAIVGLGPIPIDEDGYLDIPADFDDETVAEIERQVLLTFPKAKKA